VLIEGKVPVGEIVPVRITGANPNSLRGEAVLDGSPAGSHV
jgi:hypothetical protein